MAGREPVSRKAAPRQKVVRTERVGSWGRVEYHHYLECGHIEVRKRAAATPVLACPNCVLAETHQKEMEKSSVSSRNDDDILDELGSELAMTETRTAQVRAALVAHFGVPLEAVDVALEHDDDGVLRLQYGVVLLSAQEIKAILASQTI